MDEVDPIFASIEEARKRVKDTQKLVSHTRELIRATHRVFVQNVALYKDVQATVQRLQEQLARSRSTVRRDSPRRSARRLHLLISARTDEGRLPNTVSHTALVSGFGGECEACDGYMPSTQLVMAIAKDETFVYLHADCCVIWKAQCHLRAALQRTA